VSTLFIVVSGTLTNFNKGINIVKVYPSTRNPFFLNERIATKINIHQSLFFSYFILKTCLTIICNFLLKKMNKPHIIPSIYIRINGFRLTFNEEGSLENEPDKPPFY
jgi:hypothetical protein